ncbi:hypothetical protein IVY21_06420 [Salmonella enterica subsp. enterica serovar Worthington]|nr:hypothetical protein [Salmonella enterica subsp. enterica serovar Worthington]
MACSANLFPQIGTLREHNNVFMFRVIPDLASRLPILYAKSAEGINGGSERYRLMSSIPTRQFMVATVYVYCWSVREN